MGRAVVVAMGMWWLVGPALAANPCKSACAATRATCLKTAATAFTDAKAACPSTQPDRRTCLATARQTRAAARATCKADAKSCKQACPPPSGPLCGSHGDGITAVNVHRATAGLPPVTERADLSAGDLAHAQYIVATDTLTHPEDPNDPHYTPEGNAAGTHSDVAAFSTSLAGPSLIADVLMAAPFHGVGLIDPRLVESGFGIAHDNAGRIQTGGAIDVLSSRSVDPPVGVAFPVLYPADGMTAPLTKFPGNESPDPLTSCPGFAAPTGAPVIVQLDGTPSVTAHTLTRNGVAVDHCLFDETSYANPDGGQQALGRNVLAGRHAIVMLPRAVLKPGAYAASVTTGGQTIAWSFTVTCPRAVPGF